MNNSNLDKREKLNSLLISLFLFQYSLPMLLFRFFSPTVLVMCTSLAIIVISLCNNRGRVKTLRSLTIFMLIFLLLLVKGLIYREASAVIVFIEISGPIMLLFLNNYNCDLVLQYSFKVSFINIVLIMTYPFLSGYSYMRFGYGMVLSVVFLYIKLFDLKEYKSKLEYIVWMFATFEMVIYGPRGATFSFLLFFLIDRIFIQKKKILFNFLLILSGIVLWFKLVPILNFLEAIVKKLGVNSYSIAKFRMQMVRGAATASSGRDTIYLNAVNEIRKHPYFGGNIDLSDSDYAHNIFLQAGLDFGYFGIILVVLVLLFILVKMWQSKKSTVGYRYILCALFGLAVGRLMFSSIIWRRPEFWMLLFVYVSEKNIENRFVKYRSAKNV